MGTGKPDKSRTPGRIKHRWWDEVRSDSIQIGISAEGSKQREMESACWYSQISDGM